MKMVEKRIIRTTKEVDREWNMGVQYFETNLLALWRGEILYNHFFIKFLELTFLPGFLYKNPAD